MFETMFGTMINTLPHFLLYFSSAIFLFIVFMFLFVMCTPHNEITQIRYGNTSAAIQLVGALLGFAVPLSVIIGNSVNIADMFVWGVVALLVQLASFWVVHWWFKGISKRIVDRCVSTGVFMGGISLSVGILQAGCMVP